MSDPNGPPAGGYDAFVAAPMSALPGESYAAGRADVLHILERLSAAHGFGPVYFAGTGITGPEGFTGEAAALRQDLEALRAARLFVLVYPERIVTSALVEVGYALALRLPCLLLVRDPADLPYLLNQAASADAADLLPPLRIGRLGNAAETAARIAAFRDAMREEAARDG